MCMHMPLKTINFGEQLYIYIYICYITHTHIERESTTQFMNIGEYNPTY